jgi:hypothetical protein
MTQPLLFVGIDVSKAQLDVAQRPAGRFTVPNTEAGVTQLLAHLAAAPPTLIVVEATGGVELPLTGALAAAGLPVVVVNPRQIRDFAKATGRLAKTDALDAQVLAHFAEVVRPEPCPLPRRRSWWPWSRAVANSSRCSRRRRTAWPAPAWWFANSCGPTSSGWNGPWTKPTPTWPRRSGRVRSGGRRMNSYGVCPASARSWRPRCWQISRNWGR